MPTAEELARGLDGKNQKRQKAVDRSPMSMEILDRVTQGVPYGGVEIESIKFKLAGDPVAESLAIVTGISDDGTPVVAFHKAVSFPELFNGLVARLANGTLKWRVDEFRSR